MRLLLRHIVFLSFLSSAWALGQFGEEVRKIEAMPNDSTKVEALIELAKLYADSNLDSTYFYAGQAENLANSLSYKRGLVHVKMVYATEHFYRGEFPEAKALLQETTREADLNNFPRLMVGSRLLLGNVHAKQKDLDLAIATYKEALDICERTNNKQTASSLYVSMGIIKRMQGDLDSAEFYYNKVLKIQEEELHDSVTIASIYNNIGSIYFYKNDLITTEKYVLKALEINRAIHNVRFETINLANLGSIWGEKNGNLTKSMSYFNQAVDLAKSRGEKESLFNFYKEMAEINALHGQFERAYEFIKISNDYKDSVFGEKKQQQMLELEQQYETQKIQDSLRLKEQDLDIALINEQAAQEKASKTIWQLIGSIVLTILVLVVLFFVYRNSKNQKRINTMLTEKNEEIYHQKLIIEEKNTELTDSITYAKRIQSALLPSKEKMNDILGEHFLLFHPKDIVSGDFYWIKRKGNTTYFCVADCTGHGVPGAMVSMLGYDTLEKIASLETRNTGDFLAKVNEELINALSSQGKLENEQVKDGMDISLCSYNSKTIDFCGANNACYIIRSKEHAFPANSEKIQVHEGPLHKLIELKPNKRPIGFHHTDTSFDTQQLKMIQGDLIILFSDGYADQFGGEKGKKMKSSTFRDELLKHGNKSISELHLHLENFLKDWKGEFDQLDDITVLGIRIE